MDNSGKLVVNTYFNIALDVIFDYSVFIRGCLFEGAYTVFHGKIIDVLQGCLAVCSLVSRVF
jgi:hypothetical protein